MAEKRFEIPSSALPYGVVLEQTGIDEFRVSYGFQVDSGLSYGEACDKLGQAIMHALSCEGSIDNRDKAEARASGDRRPYYNGDAITLVGAA